MIKKQCDLPGFRRCPQCQMTINDPRTLRCPRCNTPLLPTVGCGGCSGCGGGRP